MSKIIFENNICTCEYFEETADERIEIKLIKPFNHLQIEERNCVLIAQHECELFIRGFGYTVFTTSFDNDSETVTLSCFLEEK